MVSIGVVSTRLVFEQSSEQTTTFETLDAHTWGCCAEGFDELAFAAGLQISHKKRRIALRSEKNDGLGESFVKRAKRIGSSFVQGCSE